MLESFVGSWRNVSLRFIFAMFSLMLTLKNMTLNQRSPNRIQRTEEETTMKRKWAVFLIAFNLLLLAVMLIPIGARAQGPNLLKNPGFEDGHYKQDGIREITVPNDWRMHWSDREANIFDGYEETARPETVVWNISGAPEHEKALFWKDGIFTVKIFKGWAPMWAAMSQDVGGLEVGRRYRLVAPVFIDIVAEYDSGKKVAPVDGRQGRVRLGASPVGTGWRDETNINYSGWWTGETISPFYQAYPTFIHEFTATAPDMTVWIEVASNYPHLNNGFFIDTVGLYALDEVDAGVEIDQPSQGTSEGAQPSQPSGPTPVPLPSPTPQADGAVVHVVQSGDSFWSLAIQYAEVMGLTPEEALLAIPALNNNPSVISSGMVLIIVPPSEDGGQATEESVEDEVDTGETAESSETSEELSAQATSEANTQSTIAEVLPQISPGSICVQVYEDVNGDNERAAEGEPPMADQAISLSQDGNTITTVITDGSADLHCFDSLESGTYQVRIFPSADYMVTGDDSWAVAIAEGVMIPVSFGLQIAPDSVADAGEQTGDAAADSAVEEPSSTSGLPDNLGVIVLGVAVVLVILAGAGVYLLRRG